MIPANPGPPDAPDPRPDEAAPEKPVTLSVDRLTEALAQLMADDRSGDAQQAQDREGTERAQGEANAADGYRAESPPADDENEFVTPASIVEALLFVGHPQNHPLTSRQLASYLRDVSPQEVDVMVAELNTLYAEDGSPYRIVSVGAGYRMTLQVEFSGLSERFYGRVRQAKLSQAAVDLLAIVAYHQPIARDAIDRMRGQASGATLAQLVRRQLLQVSYAPDRPRTKVYRTTDRFLDLFGLDSLEDLPSHEDF